MIYLAPCAEATDRRQWTWADHLRPLSPRGWRASVRLASRLAGAPITAVVASPTTRAVQTVSGLAIRRRLPVTVDERLGPDATPAGVLHLGASQPSGALLCTHGEVVEALLSALRARGVPMPPEVPHSLVPVWTLALRGGEVTAVGTLGPEWIQDTA
jgi:broad specificity phosphatase PhoE